MVAPATEAERVGLVAEGICGERIAASGVGCRLQRLEAGKKDDEREHCAEDDIKCEVIATDNGSKGDSDGYEEKDDSSRERVTEKNEGYGKCRGDMRAGEGDGMDAAVAEDPAVEGSSLIDWRSHGRIRDE